jgi:hypothetical protein
VVLALVAGATWVLVPVGPGAQAAGRSSVPDVVVDESAASDAPRIEAPIVEVTVFSDRARIRRRGRAPAKAGARVVRLPDLPGATFLDSVRLSATDARVLRVVAAPIARERLEIEQAKKLLDELDAVDDAFAELNDRAARDEWLLATITRLSPAPPVPEEKREGRRPLALDVGSWLRALDFLGERATAARVRLVGLAEERRMLGERRAKLRADLEALNRGGFAARAIEVTAVVEPGSGAAAPEVELEYFVPGALWRPAYDVHFASASGQIRLETTAMVEQATGEDWERATLLLSTAMPARGVALPELMTWTLGERGDFIPRPRPKPAPAPVAPLVSGLPQGSVAAAHARGVEAALVRERLARALSGPADVPTETSAPAPPPELMEPMLQKSVGNVMRHGATAAADGVSGVPAAAPAEEHVVMDDSDEIAAVRAPRPMAVSAAPLVGAPAIRRSKKATASGSEDFAGASAIPLSLLEGGPVRPPERLWDPSLPAVAAGGLDTVYRAPVAATIPSTGQQIRIPLASQSFRATAFHEATPALATTAFLRARVRNDGKRPLLRGAATVFGDGELVGVGEIKTTGPGGDIELPLGADQDIRLVHQIVPSTKTTGLIMKSEETTYDVQIQVGNYKKQPVVVEVMDQLPTSRRDKVEVKLLGAEPAALGAPDAEGVIRWRVELPAGGKKTLRLRYAIVRPKGWVLFQR